VYLADEKLSPYRQKSIGRFASQLDGISLEVTSDSFFIVEEQQKKNCTRGNRGILTEVSLQCAVQIRDEVHFHRLHR